MTPVQLTTFKFIDRFIEKHGWSPTYSEIAEGVGLASKSWARAIVAALAEQGEITVKPNRARSIQITPRAPRTPEGIEFLDQQLAVWVRVVAARLGVTPLEVVTEAVRDAYLDRTKSAQTVPRETSEAPQAA